MNGPTRTATSWPWPGVQGGEPRAVRVDGGLVVEYEGGGGLRPPPRGRDRDGVGPLTDDLRRGADMDDLAERAVQPGVLAGHGRSAEVVVSDCDADAGLLHEPSDRLGDDGCAFRNQEKIKSEGSLCLSGPFGQCTLRLANVTVSGAVRGWAASTVSAGCRPSGGGDCR
ncbi:hypothetical protein GCM10010507_10050 [Streptomyces cinnamoneus]|uniref:Uncharacterized protein n=1 Tax=Streptomyces cinnamoneus TaxID=53446 RepID=A0A918TBF9_STRCJ|nr:hypothetical protein GCM10010507_10050 [Streptomyces cinnamoneus]